MVGAASTVLPRRAAELAHRDQRDVLAVCTHVLPEGRNGLRELLEPVGELTVRPALVLVGVPATDVGKRGLHAQICLQQLRNLLHAVAECCTGIIHARGRFILGRVGGLEHLDRLKGLLAGAVQHRVRALVVHRLKGIRDRRGLRPLACDRKIRQVGHRDRRNLALQRTRHLRSQRNGSEGRRLTRQRLILQRAVQPAIGSRLHAGRAALHVILRVKVRARGVRRARRVNNRQVSLVIQRLERRHLRMQPKEPVQVDDLILLDRNRRPHGVVVRLGVRHHHVQAVAGAALEDHHQLLLVGRRRRHLGIDRPCQEARNHGRSHQRQRTALHKAAPRHRIAPGHVAPVHVASPVACIRVDRSVRHGKAP